MAEPKLDFGGEEQFNTAPETLYAALTDLDVLAANLPDLESAKRAGPHTLECVVKPGFSFLRGTLRSTMKIDPYDPPRQARMEVFAKGIGVTMRIESEFAVEPSGGGSKLTWQARLAEATGLVATVSPALVKAAAEQIVRRSWSQIRSHLGE